MNYAAIKDCDVADGPGVRVTLFVSGCTNHCEGCFQPATWDFHFGREYTEETEERILKLLDKPFVDGLTLLGGEPFEPENQRVLAGLCKRVKEKFPSKTIWAYTGFIYDRDRRDAVDGGCPRGRAVCPCKAESGAHLPRVREPAGAGS